MHDTGHTLPQTPQSMHFSSMITCSVFFAPIIASVGHFGAQAVQPMQVSWIKCGISCPFDAKQKLSQRRTQFYGQGARCQLCSCALEFDCRDGVGLMFFLLTFSFLSVLPIIS